MIGVTASDRGHRLRITHPTLILPSGDIGGLTQMLKYCQSLPFNEKTQRIYDQLARAYQSFCSIYQSLSLKGKVRLQGKPG